MFKSLFYLSLYKLYNNCKLFFTFMKSTDYRQIIQGMSVERLKQIINILKTKSWLIEEEEEGDVLANDAEADSNKDEEEAGTIQFHEAGSGCKNPDRVW